MDPGTIGVVILLTGVVIGWLFGKRAHQDQLELARAERSLEIARAERNESARLKDIYIDKFLAEVKSTKALNQLVEQLTLEKEAANGRRR